LTIALAYPLDIYTKQITAGILRWPRETSEGVVQPARKIPVNKTIALLLRATLLVS
jgi:hypothetical protein